jgi:hypothetical protein
MIISKDIPMNAEYRRKTSQIKQLELIFLYLAGISFAALLALLTSSLRL